MKAEPKIKQLGITKSELAEVLKVCARKDICEHFKVSERTLDRIIYEYQLQRANYGPKNLDKQTVADIRNLYATGKHTQKEIAEKYNVSQSLVCKIVNMQVHKNPASLKVSGEAEVRLGLKYGN